MRVPFDLIRFELIRQICRINSNHLRTKLNRDHHTRHDFVCKSNLFCFHIKKHFVQNESLVYDECDGAELIQDLRHWQALTDSVAKQLLESVIRYRALEKCLSELAELAAIER